MEHAMIDVRSDKPVTTLLIQKGENAPGPWKTGFLNIGIPCDPDQNFSQPLLQGYGMY
jgi:hypothetical protein